MQAKVAEWTLVVTIDPPKAPHGLSAIINGLKDTVGTIKNVSSITRRYWKERIKEAERTLSPGPRISHRGRRSLFGIGGKALHSLFGVATDSDVLALRKVVDSIRHQHESIMHSTNQMITVVNHTHIIAKENG